MRTPVERELVFKNFMQAVAFAPAGGEVKVLLEKLMDEVMLAHQEANALLALWELSQVED